MSQQPQDDRGLARQALGSAVASYGISILSDPRALREVLTRLLPNSPRERSLLSAAAGADVASRLRRHIQEGYEDPGRAVQAVARELAERTAIEMAACLWVTGEFDRVLGYPESSGTTLAYATQQLADDQLPPVQPEPPPWGGPQPGFGGYQEQAGYGVAGAGITPGSQQPMMQPPGVQPPGIQPGVQPPAVPPAGATGEGTVSWSGRFFPQHEGQVLECEEVSGNQPAYTWTMPTEYAFIVAQGAPGSSFAALQTWWTDDAGPNTAPSPATP